MFFPRTHLLLADARESRSAPSQVSLCAEIKKLASHTCRFFWLIQDQPYTANYKHSSLSRVPFLPSFSFIGTPAKLEGRLNLPSCNLAFFLMCVCSFFFFSPTSCPDAGLHAKFLREIQSTLECPSGLHSKAELCGWVWEEKCNDLHLNGSTLANTMGLSFTGLGPLLRPKGTCRDRALMRQQACLRLGTNHCLHVYICVCSVCVCVC